MRGVAWWRLQDPARSSRLVLLRGLPVARDRLAPSSEIFGEIFRGSESQVSESTPGSARPSTQSWLRRVFGFRLSGLLWPRFASRHPRLKNIHNSGHPCQIDFSLTQAADENTLRLKGAIDFFEVGASDLTLPCLRWHSRLPLFWTRPSTPPKTSQQ